LVGVHKALVSSPTLREAITHGDLNVTIKYVYAAIAAIAWCAVAASIAPTAGQRHVWLIAAVACGGCIYFATGRATIVSGAIVGVVAYFTAGERRISGRRVIVVACGLVVLGLTVFLLVGALIGKTFANNEDLQRIPSVFTKYSALAQLALPYEYVTAPIAALNVQVSVATPWGDAHGCALASSLCAALRKAGLRVPVVRRVRPFTAPPLKWNTYTALDAPLIDGGKGLVMPIVAVIGLAVGLLWRAARRRTILGAIGYSIEAVALVTASGSSNFTAPHLIGALVFSVFAFWLATGVPRARERLTHRGVGGSGLGVC